MRKCQTPSLLLSGGLFLTMPFLRAGYSRAKRHRHRARACARARGHGLHARFGCASNESALLRCCCNVSVKGVNNYALYEQYPYAQSFAREQGRGLHARFTHHLNNTHTHRTSHASKRTWAAAAT